MKNFFFFFLSFVGKSTIINSIINESIEIENLLKPAITNNDMHGCTIESTQYISKNGKYKLIDTVGLTDNRFDINIKIKQLRNG